MRTTLTKLLRTFFIAAVVILSFSLLGSDSALSAPFRDGGGDLCLSSKDTDVELRLYFSDNGFVSGDFCIDGCGCGTVLGEAHIADVEGTPYGTIDLYADLAELCAYGVWYSIDMPSLSHIWYYTALDSTRLSGTGGFEEISCTAPQ